jgi:hypothetical protein
MRIRSWGTGRAGAVFVRVAVFCSLITFSTAQVPDIINYQGRVVVNGTNFTGTGQFKFAFVDEGTNTSSQATATGNVTEGVILSYSIGSGGSGYISPPGVTITDSTGSGATATAQISPAGVVTNIVRGGLGDGNYSTSPTVIIAPPPPNLAYETYWSSGGAAISLTVYKGLYSVLLGDTTVTGMAPLSSTVFTNSDVRLRVWFDDGSTGLQQLAPDQRVGASGYALAAAHAQTADQAAYAQTALGADLLDGKHSDQLKVIVASSQSAATTYIGSTITNYSNGEVTITVPRNGRIVVEANAWVILYHVNGTPDTLSLTIGATSTDAGNSYNAVRWDIPSENPTASSVDRTFTVRRSFVVTAGTYTYYLNGRMLSGDADFNDKFWFSAMLATFYPET